MEQGRHIFVSYVSEDDGVVSRLASELERAGFSVWRDRSRLEPGDRWRSEIRRAIRGGAAFLACFSPASEARARSYMREEVELACEELRLRSHDRAWFIPILLGGTEVPDLPIGGTETLRDLQRVDLHDDWELGVRRLATALRRADPVADLEGGTPAAPPRQGDAPSASGSDAGADPDDAPGAAGAAPLAKLLGGLAVLLVGLLTAWAAGAFDGAKVGTRSGCVIVDATTSPRDLRPYYFAEFASFASEIATSGSGRLCVVYVGGAETQRQELDLRPHDPGGSIADAEVRDNVSHAGELLRNVLRASTAHRPGTALIEASLQTADYLVPGDALLLLTDGVQSTREIGDFRTADLSGVGIDQLLARLSATGFLADLSGVEVRMPLLPWPNAGSVPAERALGIRRFWEAWAEKAGGSFATSTVAEAQR